MEQPMDMVFLLIRKGAQCMMETGKMINMMAMELKLGIIILSYIKETLYRAKRLVKESFSLMETIMKEILLMVSFMERAPIILLIQKLPIRETFIKII
jgi:hypothetical protein